MPQSRTVNLLVSEVRADKIILGASANEILADPAPPPYEATKRPLRLLSLGM